MSIPGPSLWTCPSLPSSPRDPRAAVAQPAELPLRRPAAPVDAAHHPSPLHPHLHVRGIQLLPMHPQLLRHPLKDPVELPRQRGAASARPLLRNLPSNQSSRRRPCSNPFSGCGGGCRGTRGSSLEGAPSRRGRARTWIRRIGACHRRASEASVSGRQCTAHSGTYAMNPPVEVIPPDRWAVKGSTQGLRSAFGELPPGWPPDLVGSRTGQSYLPDGTND